MNRNAEIAIMALHNFQGDNLRRAKIAFRDFTPEQMAEPYGDSGNTRQQVLDEYQAHHDEVAAAIQWVRSAGEN